MAILNKSDLFNGRSEELIKATFRETYFLDEKRRIECTEERLRMLWDDYICDVAKKIQSIVDPETYMNSETLKGLKDFVDVTYNVYKAVITQLAMIYKKSPIREFTENEEIFEVTYGIKEKNGIKSSLFDTKFKKANMYMQALNDVYLYFVERNGQIDIDVLAPNNLHIIPKEDNPTVPDVIMIRRYPTAQECGGRMYKPNEEYWIVWTDKEHYRLVKNGKVWMRVAVPGNEEMINPYGVLPFVGIHKSDNEAIWNITEGEDLYQLGLWSAAFMSIWNQNWTWHNFKQLFIASENELPAGMGRAPDKFLTGPFESKATVLDWSIDTGDLLEQIEKKVAMVAANYGVDMSFTMADTQGESGVKLKIKQSKLKELRNEQIKTLTKAEMEGFEVLKAILNYRDSKNYNGEMNIKYHDMEIHQDAKENLDIAEREISSDIISIVDAFLQKFPHYTREKAIEKLKQNIRENNELRGMRDASLTDEIGR